MSYGIVLSPEFMAELVKLPPELAEHVLDEVDRLAADPVLLSKRADLDNAFYQIYECSGFLSSRRSRFEMRFQYGQDEQALHIAELVYVPESDE